MRKSICIVAAFFMLTAILSGCDALRKLGFQQNDDDELRPVSSIVMNEDEAKKLTDKVLIRLYFANEDNSKLRVEIRYIPMSEAKKSVNNLASVIVKELIKGPGAKTGLKSTIPERTKLRSPVSINAGTATVDFTKEFIDNHPGGKETERITIYSIVNSLTELKEIQKVMFTIDGKSRKEFKGGFQFDAAFPRSTGLISNEPVVRANEDENSDDTDKNENKEQDGDSETNDDKTKKTSGEYGDDIEDSYIEILE